METNPFPHEAWAQADAEVYAHATSREHAERIYRRHGFTPEDARKLAGLIFSHEQGKLRHVPLALRRAPEPRARRPARRSRSSRAALDPAAAAPLGGPGQNQSRGRRRRLPVNPPLFVFSILPPADPETETTEELCARLQAMIDAAKVPKDATHAEAAELLRRVGFDELAADRWAWQITYRE